MFGDEGSVRRIRGLAGGILALGLMFGGMAGAATLRAEMTGVVAAAIDNLGEDGIGLFGPPGGRLVGSRFQIVTSWRIDRITASATGEEAVLRRIGIRLGSGLLALPGGLISLILPDVLPAHYTVDALGQTGALSYEFHAEAMIAPTPFGLAQPLGRSDTTGPDGHLLAVLRDATGAEIARSDLLLETTSLQVSSVPAPLPLALLLTGLMLLAWIGKRPPRGAAVPVQSLRLSRLRSLGSSRRLRRRMTLGVTSTNSSSSM